MKTITVDFSWFHVSKLHFEKFNFMTKLFSVVKKNQENAFIVT